MPADTPSPTPRRPVRSGRPPLTLGTYRTISTAYYAGGAWHRCDGKPPGGARPERWRARTQFRPMTGKTGQREKTAATRTKAIAALETMLAAEGGRPIGEQPTATLTDRSRVRHAVELYLAQMATEVQDTTLAGYESACRNHITPAIGELTLAECTAGRLNGLIRDMATQNLSPATRRAVRARLGGIFDVAVDEGAITVNPVRSMKRIKGGNLNPRRKLTPGEVREFLAKVDDDQLAVDRGMPTMFRLMLVTGMRVGEAVALRWADLNLTDQPVAADGGGALEPITLPGNTAWINGNMVFVRGQPPQRHGGKTSNADRLNALPLHTVAMLMVHRPMHAEDHDPVFPRAVNQFYTATGMAKEVTRMRRRLALPEHITSHICRRTVASDLNDSDQATLREIANQLGQSDINTLQRHYLVQERHNTAVARIMEQIRLGGRVPNT